MKAYELATGLENHFKGNFITSESALLLRQQADRIAELEKELSWWRSNYTLPTNEKQNEPIAWTWFSSEENTSPYTQMTGYTTECWSRNKPDESVKVDEGTLMPLYTAPQTKPLSDDEVIKIRQTTKAKSTENWADTLAFARAIEERRD